MNKVAILAAVALFGARDARAQGSAVPLPPPPSAKPIKFNALPTTAEITERDLMSRLYVYADDSLMGREFATEGNTKATAWIAEQVRQLGLVPMGDNGTFFQTLPVVMRTLAQEAHVSTDAGVLQPWVDFLPRDQGRAQRAFDGVPVIFAGSWGDAGMITDAQAAGKFVVVRNMARRSDGTLGPAATIDRRAVAGRFQSAAAIAVASLDLIPPELREQLKQPASEYRGDATEAAAAPAPAFMYVSARGAQVLLGAAPEVLLPGAAGHVVRGTAAYVEGPTPFPARNVVAMLPGTNPALRGQYVAIGAHNDHIGIGQAVDHDSLYLHNRMFRQQGADGSNPRLAPDQMVLLNAAIDSVRKIRTPRIDSIYNGADDDGSGTVTVLEVAEALVKGSAKPQRSVLFVWHTGEEAGLYGSQYFTDHPTVPRDSIVAQLNIDMVGRGEAWDTRDGGPGYLQIIGSRRLSTELGNLIERVNTDSRHGLRFDYAYDANGHPEQYYCRSDHYMYARYGIPVAFFSTGGHPDYHMVTDEPQYINYAHMVRVGLFVKDLLLAVGNLDHRVVVDKVKPDPRGQCRQ